jgi:hypothetical protein
MLPSFRLIAATFLCGFVVVFAGLRLAASLNVIHESLPVMAAHAAPMPVAPAADREARRSASSVPVMYDLRFAVNAISPTLVRNVPSAIDRAIPLLPLAILPPDLAPAEAQTPEAETAVAALAPAAPVETPPSITPEPPAVIVVEPLPSLATEAPAPAAPEARTAAIDPQSMLVPEAAPAEPAADDPADTSSIDVPPPAAEPPALADIPLPAVKPQQTGAAPKAAKPKPRKPRARSVQRPASNNSFDVNNPASSPFGSQH